MIQSAIILGGQGKGPGPLGLFSSFCNGKGRGSFDEKENAFVPLEWISYPGV